jgi:hypothetical protein
MAIENVGHLYRCAKEPIFMASSYMVQSFLTRYGKIYNWSQVKSHTCSANKPSTRAGENGDPDLAGIENGSLSINGSITYVVFAPRTQTSSDVSSRAGRPPGSAVSSAAAGICISTEPG